MQRPHVRSSVSGAFPHSARRQNTFRLRNGAAALKGPSLLPLENPGGIGERHSELLDFGDETCLTAVIVVAAFTTITAVGPFTVDAAWVNIAENRSIAAWDTPRVLANGERDVGTQKQTWVRMVAL